MAVHSNVISLLDLARAKRLPLVTPADRERETTPETKASEVTSEILAKWNDDIKAIRPRKPKRT